MFTLIGSGSSAAPAPASAPVSAPAPAPVSAPASTTVVVQSLVGVGNAVHTVARVTTTSPGSYYLQISGEASSPDPAILPSHIYALVHVHDAGHTVIGPAVMGGFSISSVPANMVSVVRSESAVARRCTLSVTIIPMTIPHDKISVS